MKKRRKNEKNIEFASLPNSVRVLIRLDDREYRRAKKVKKKEDRRY